MKSSEVTNVWLDCDPGHDDAFAILLCAFSNKINLLGISTVSGNQLIGHMTSNTLKILNSIGFISESKTGIKTDKTLEFSECKNIGGIRCPVIEGNFIEGIRCPVIDKFFELVKIGWLIERVDRYLFF